MSESMDMDFVFDKEAPVIREYLDRFAPIAHQIGAVFLVNAKAVGMDDFGKAKPFAKVFNNLLESYALDAVDRYKKESDAGNVNKQSLDILAAALSANA